MRALKITCAILSALGLFAAIWMYRQIQQMRQSTLSEIRIYNQWVSYMVAANSSLGSFGIGEKPQIGQIGYTANPNDALIEAYSWVSTAEGMASGVSSMLNTSQEFFYMENVSSALQGELHDLYDKGTYSRRTFQYSIQFERNARDFMHKQMSEVLHGMPQNISTLSQLRAQAPHLQSLGNLGGGILKSAFDQWVSVHELS